MLMGIHLVSAYIIDTSKNSYDHESIMFQNWKDFSELLCNMTNGNTTIKFAKYNIRLN